MLEELITMAREKAAGQEISFCGAATTWEECVTTHDGYTILWFNIGRDTMIVKKEEK
jgi:hypothetical protein